MVGVRGGFDLAVCDRHIEEDLLLVNVELPLAEERVFKPLTVGELDKTEPPCFPIYGVND